jgi:hypothetical protein
MEEKVLELRLIRTQSVVSSFAVKSGRNSGTGAETAGVNTAGRNRILFCAFFARLKKPGHQHENRGAKI